jgi:hypothetical protein
VTEQVEIKESTGYRGEDFSQGTLGRELIVKKGGREKPHPSKIGSDGAFYFKHEATFDQPN